jgi:hypothetical protein
MVEKEALNAKLEGYLKDPNDTLGLSGMELDTEGGANTVASFLPKW